MIVSLGEKKKGKDKDGVPRSEARGQEGRYDSAFWSRGQGRHGGQSEVVRRARGSTMEKVAKGGNKRRSRMSGN